MRITIVTAVRNNVKMIRDAMDSVLRQKTDGIEIEYIVVDGGSTDGTVDRIREFEAQAKAKSEKVPSGFSFRWISENDRGLYDAINKGIRMATGDVVGICNSDDVLAADDILVRIADAFTDDLDCVYGKVRFVRELGGRTVRRCFARFWRPWMIQWGYMTPHPGVFIRRACFEKWGYYVPSRDEYKIAADCELLIRFFRVHKMRAKYLFAGTHVMRMGGISTRDLNARVTLNREVIKANRANGYFCCWPMLLPKYFIKVWEIILPRIGHPGK